jgi:hypothetical protein
MPVSLEVYISLRDDLFETRTLQILSINQEFIDKLGFYDFKSLDDICGSLSRFFNIEAVNEIILTVPLSKDE